jgi:DNA-binding MarR family transcriptional regulator
METKLVTTKTIPERPISMGRQLNFAAGASMTMCNAMLATHGVTLPQWVVLSALWQKDGLTVGAIADYSGNNLPATSRILGRMIEKGLLRREEDEMDGRAVRVALCPAGEDLRGLAQFHEQVNAALMAGFSEQETAQLFALLARVEQNARGWGQTPETDQP